MFLLIFIDFFYFFCFAISHFHVLQFQDIINIIASIVVFINFPISFSFTFYYYCYYCYYYFGFVFTSFLLLIKQLLFPYEMVKVSRLFCLFVCLFFFSWNCRVIISNFITFLPFQFSVFNFPGLQFSSFIFILT